MAFKIAAMVVQALDRRVFRGDRSEINHGELMTVSARQISDGMLRMTAIATALLAGSRGLAIDRVGIEPPSLNNLFLRLTGRALRD